MNIQLIDNQIARCEGQIESLTERLPYADGGAYSQDKQRISELRTELAQWQELRAEVADCEEFRISSNIHQTNRELAEQQRDQLAVDLGVAAETLRRYETLHRAKNTEESNAKAELNAELAARFEATIAKSRGEQ